MKYTGKFMMKHISDNNAQNIFFPIVRGRANYIYSALLNDLFFSINNVYSNVYNTITYITIPLYSDFSLLYFFFTLCFFFTLVFLLLCVFLLSIFGIN